jgi:probable F420-dependent oxidoreductase
MLGAVGPLMTEAVGEVADGLLCHPFSTPRYVREVTLLALERGRAKAGKGLVRFEISGPSMIVAEDSDAEIAAGTQSVRQQIAFYGSTPAYRGVLELDGWGALHEELNWMAQRGEWDRMPGAIDGDVLRTVAIIGTPEEAVAEIALRYGDVVTRITITIPEDRDPERWNALLRSLL